MSIAITCSQCGQKYRVADAHAGKAARCACGAAVQVPQSAAAKAPLKAANLEPAPSLLDEIDVGSLRPIAQLPASTAVPWQRKAVPAWNLRRILFAVGFSAAGVTALALCAGVYSLTQPPIPSAAATQPLVYDVQNLPHFPDRGVGVEVEPGVLMEELRLGNLPYLHQRGHSGKFIVYLPAGQHAPKSLPCVLITAAGSNLLTGMALSEGDRVEHLPYARAGLAVVAYELDGDPYDPRAPRPAVDPYMMFRSSQAGLVNARIAIEFALQKMPEVNPSRIYVAGHSSAATHALLVAEYEQRLAGVIAYAPIINVPRRYGAGLRVLSWQLPGVVDFATRISPHTRAANLKCPVYLFQAEDDFGCPLDIAREFVDQLKQQGTEVKFVTVQSGGHYESMLQQGIPAAIQWLREQNRR